MGRVGDIVDYEAPTGGRLKVEIVGLDEPTRPAAPTTVPSTAVGVPAGGLVELPGRGTTFIREVAGPPGAPTSCCCTGCPPPAG